MRATWTTLAVWASVGLTFFGNPVAGRAQPGTEEGGAVLRNPFDDPAPRAAPKSNPNVQGGAPGAPASSTGGSAVDQILRNLSIDPRYAMNRDIQPTPELGPWMICVHSYVTKEAPEWSREMAAELRANPKYRLPAYVFTYGMQERHKEYLRVKELLDKQREFIKDQGLPIIYADGGKNRNVKPLEVPDKVSFDQLMNMVGNAGSSASESDDLPLAFALSLLKVKHIQVQCAVLVGGYATEDAAHRAAAAIRKLPDPDPTRIKLDEKYYDLADPTKKINKERVYVNPLKKAFVCRNPSLPQERRADQPDGLDANSLRKLNSAEPFSLLNCKKPITLAIKQFQTFTAVESKEESSNILEKFGFKTVTGEGVDRAGHDAHNLAEYLRKSRLDAYVLHTKFSSIVTVGGFDSLEDPALRAMQSTLQERLRTLETGMRTSDGRPMNMMFFPRPMPMKVPH